MKEKEATEAKAYFQAIGTIKAKVFTEETADKGSRFTATLEGEGAHEYSLVVSRHLAAKLRKRTNTDLFLLVYPRVKFDPQTKQPTASFQLVAFREENCWGEINIFTLKGIWQWVPLSKIPVITVYRNKQSSDLSGRFKAAHLPVLMKRQFVQPFRYNSRKVKKDQGTRYFLQIKALFLPQRDSWCFVQDISEPTEKVPAYRKPVKKPINNEQNRSDRFTPANSRRSH